MNNYIALTKVLIKTGLNMESLNSKRKKNGKVKKPMSSMANLVLSLVICLPLAVMMGFVGMGMQETFAVAGTLDSGFEMLAGMGAVMVLVFSIPYVLSVFFMSSDLESLLPLPLKPGQIIAAKFTSVMIYEYLIIAMFYAPMLIGFGIAAKAGIIFWLIAVVSILVLPVTPLTYASFFAIIMMRLLKNVKNKDMITTVGTFLMIFVIMGFSMSAGSMAGGSMAGGVGNGAEAMAGLASKMGSFSKLGLLFPNGKLLASALAGSDLLMMLLYLLSAGAILSLFLWLSGKIYFSGVKSMGETSSKKKKVSHKELMDVTQARKPKHAFMMKEIKTLFRSPEYFTNCLMMPLIFPPIMLASMVVPMVSSMKTAGEDVDIKSMLAGFASGSGAFVLPVVLLVVFALAVLISGSNYATTTCLSREGRSFIYMKYIPMRYRDQLEAKSLCGLLIGFFASAPYVLAIAILATVFFRLNVSVIILAFAVDFFTLMLCNYIQLWFDIRSPKLNWENEQGAVRQNYNTAIAMFAVFILGGLMGAGAFLFFKLLPLPSGALIGILLAVLVALAFLVRAFVLSYGESKLKRMEP